MMLQRAIESKFLLMMIEITVMNEAAGAYPAPLVRGTIYTGIKEECRWRQWYGTARSILLY
jgi:hypothetical protein